MTEPKRPRGRPPGSKNRTTPPLAGNGASIPVSAGAEPSSGSSSPAGSTRAGLEADRDRLLKSIEDAGKAECPECHRGGDPKIEAALQSQLNGVHRMLLRISGETAPTDTNLVKSPQWGRIKAKLFDCLSKKHPAAWADVLAIESDEAR